MSNAFRYLQPWGFGESGVIVTREEDYWDNPLKRLERVFTYPTQSAFDEQFVPLQPLLDEDQLRWATLAIRSGFVYPQPWSIDHSAIIVTREEDYWDNPLKRLDQSFNWIQQWPFDEQYVAPLPAFDDNELAPRILRISPFIINRIEPWSFGESAKGLFGIPDEDQIAPRLVRLFNWIQSRIEPWSFDANTLRLSNAFLSAEDQIWTNYVAPTVFTINGLRQWPFDMHERFLAQSLIRRMYVTRQNEVLNLDSFPE